MTRTELLKIAKPILFNTEMVKAILEGRKTVTRRVINWDIVNKCDMERDGTLLCFEDEYGDHIRPEKLCRYQPGNILYVRETWTLEEFYDDEALIRFKAGGSIGIDYECEGDTYSKLLKYADKKWNPSLFMPKEAARIFLMVKSVRVERLQDICGRGTPQDHVTNIAREGIQLQAVMENYQKQIDDFKQLWNSTIKKTELEQFGWDANPYVWVIEFERIESEGE